MNSSICLHLHCSHHPSPSIINSRLDYCSRLPTCLPASLVDPAVRVIFLNCKPEYVAFLLKPSAGFLSWLEEKAKSLQLPLQGTQVPLGLHVLPLSTITFCSSDTDLITFPRTHQNIPASGPLHVLFSHPRMVFLQYPHGSQSASCLCSVLTSSESFSDYLTRNTTSSFIVPLLFYCSSQHFLLLYVIYLFTVCLFPLECKQNRDLVWLAAIPLVS